MGTIYLVVAAILWGLIGPLSKFIFTQGVSPLETAFWRGAIAGSAYFLHWLKFRYPLPKNPKDILLILLFGVFGVAGLEGTFVYSVKYGGAALASILLYSAPIWVNLFSLIFFKEHIPNRRWLALTISFIGVVGICLAGSSFTLSWPAIIWGLLSGLSYALFYLAGKRFFAAYHPVVVFMIAFPVGSFAILPIIMKLLNLNFINALTNVFTAPTTTLAACAFLGIVSTYIPYLLYAQGLQKMSSGRASIITMVEPIVSVVISALFWNEIFSITGYIFAALVLVGVVCS